MRENQKIVEFKIKVHEICWNMKPSIFKLVYKFVELWIWIGRKYLHECIPSELFLLLMTSLFTFHYHFLSFSCYWRRPVPNIYLTLPHIFLPFITLHLTLPYLISYLSLPYLTFCLTLRFTFRYLTLPYILPYLSSYLTLPYLLPYILPYLTS